jgi:hypothetical protein
MRVGIASYDGPMHRWALEREPISPSVPESKREPRWCSLAGWSAIRRELFGS